MSDGAGAAATSPAFHPAIELVASGRHPLERMHTHAVGLDEAERDAVVIVP